MLRLYLLFFLKIYLRKRVQGFGLYLFSNAVKKERLCKVIWLVPQ